MSGEVSSAEEVFLRCRQMDFTAQEQRYRFVPKPGGCSVTLEGKVAKVSAGYAFVAVSGSSNFYWSASLFGTNEVREGAEIAFAPGFSVRGPIVVEVKRVGAPAPSAP